MREIVSNLTTRLPEGSLQRLLLELRICPSNGDPRSLQEIASRVGVTRERARQLEVALYEKLRKVMVARGVDRLA